MSTSLGRSVDEFLDMRKSANYLACSECGHTIDCPEKLPSDWKFSIMGLRPSKFLKTIQGICPECQKQRAMFKGLLDRIDHP